MLAKDIMTKNVAVVTADTTIDEVSRIFVNKNISGLPVVNQYNKLIGIVSEGDLVYKQKPVLDLDRIKLIKEKINVPLVMHGEQTSS